MFVFVPFLYIYAQGLPVCLSIGLKGLSVSLLLCCLCASMSLRLFSPEFSFCVRARQRPCCLSMRLSAEPRAAVSGALAERGSGRKQAEKVQEQQVQTKALETSVDSWGPRDTLSWGHGPGPGCPFWLACLQN